MSVWLPAHSRLNLDPTLFCASELLVLYKSTRPARGSFNRAASNTSFIEFLQLSLPSRKLCMPFSWLDPSIPPNGLPTLGLPLYKEWS